MKFEFSTSEYEWTYGKAPRGYGYWYFKAEGHEFGASGTYADAKKKAKEYYKSIAPKGYSELVIVKVLT